jgi:hypothetical protein
LPKLQPWIKVTATLYKNASMRIPTQQSTLSLILKAKDNCFKTTYIIIFILHFKTLVFFCFLRYGYNLLWHTYPGLQSTVIHSQVNCFLSEPFFPLSFRLIFPSRAEWAGIFVHQFLSAIGWELFQRRCLASLKWATEVQKASGKEMQVVIVGRLEAGSQQPGKAWASTLPQFESWLCHSWLWKS